MAITIIFQICYHITCQQNFTPIPLFHLAGSLLLYRRQFCAVTTSAACSEAEQHWPPNTPSELLYRWARRNRDTSPALNMLHKRGYRVNWTTCVTRGSRSLSTVRVRISRLLGSHFNRMGEVAVVMVSVGNKSRSTVRRMFCFERLLAH